MPARFAEPNEFADWTDAERQGLLGTMVPTAPAAQVRWASDGATPSCCTNQAADCLSL